MLVQKRLPAETGPLSITYLVLLLFACLPTSSKLCRSLEVMQKVAVHLDQEANLEEHLQDLAVQVEEEDSEVVLVSLDQVVAASEEVWAGGDDKICDKCYY